MEQISKVVVTLTDDKGYPLHVVKLSTMLVSDVNSFVAGVKLLDPSMGTEQIVRAIWRYGSRDVRNNLSRGIKPTDKQLPPVSDLKLK